MLYAGATLDSVLLAVFGGDVEGARWQHEVWRMLTCGNISEGRMHDVPQRHHDSTDRLTLTWLVRVLASIRRRKGNRLVAQSRELYQPTQAARLHVSVSTVYRRTALAQAAGLVKRWQPPADSEDALMAKDGEWSFNEYIPARALPPMLMHRLRLCWGEVEEHAPSSAQSQPPAASVPHARPSSAPVPLSGAPPPVPWDWVPPGTADSAAAVVELLKRPRTT